MTAPKLKDDAKNAIRDEFVHGYVDDDGKRVFPSIQALCKRHDIAQSTLYRYVEKEGWQSQKDRVQTEIEMKRDAERMKRLLDDGRKFDDDSLDIAQKMLNKVARRLLRGFKAEENQPDVDGIPTMELKELSNIAINAQKIGKLALGQAQEISKVSADVSSPEAFREVMEQLDEIAAARSSRYQHTLQ